MMIVFVYDTECCQEEADDPVSAVLYFHPSWVSDIQKLSLCGQLMGTTHFLRESFFQPKIIGLQSGKFVLKQFGRFTLAVGTDRNISESILEHRANLLTSLLKIYHCDIQTIHDQFSINGQYKNLSEKLYHIFETYLPILQYNGNIFQSVPILTLPKSSSNIFLEAIQTLQSCQQTKGVLGGTILYHNKVVASQLTPDLTKKLILTDPHRIKSTAEGISVQFHIPVGVQLIVLYVTSVEFRKLSQESQRAQNAFNNNSTVLPFQIKRKMKRDKSIIFTNIPEEEPLPNNPETSYFKPNTFNRPNHLPLRFKNVTSKDIPESGFNSINFDESDSFPEFIGRTSVVSTPMTENKILHGLVLPICANTNDIEIPDETTKKIQKDNINKFLNFNPDYSNYVNNPNQQRRRSLEDLRNSIKKISKKLSLRPFGIGLSKISTGDMDEEDDNIEIDDLDKKIYRTINDPTFPLFNNDGTPISKYLYQEFLDKQYNELSSNGIVNGFELIPEQSQIDGFDSDIKASPKKVQISEAVEAFEDNQIVAKTPSENRKSLSLPIKSLNLEPGKESSSDISVNSSIFDEPARRSKFSGIQLTPLMNKLTILAMADERSSGFSSWDTTPGVDVQPFTPIDGNKLFKRRQSLKFEETSFEDSNGESLQKVELFVCGQQNMTLLLLLEENSGQKQELIQAMVSFVYSVWNKI